MESLNNNLEPRATSSAQIGKNKHSVCLAAAAAPPEERSSSHHRDVGATARIAEVEETREEGEVGDSSVPSISTDNLEVVDLFQLELGSSRSLLQVDPILDFWLVDEELIGRFRVSSHSNSCQAIIFKIKTTSPYHFWVSPAFGLMRANVSASVDVKCDQKLSRSKLEMDQFLLQAAAVPLASTAMTSDLYTSAVPSNLPELLRIWEQAETSELKESHRIACRFQGASQPVHNLEDNGNLVEVECFLAREYPESLEKSDKATVSAKMASSPRTSCSAVRRLQIISFSLAILLIGSLAYIFYYNCPVADNLRNVDT